MRLSEHRCFRNRVSNSTSEAVGIPMLWSPHSRAVENPSWESSFRHWNQPAAWPRNRCGWPFRWSAHVGCGGQSRRRNLRLCHVHLRPHPGLARQSADRQGQGLHRQRLQSGRPGPFYSSSLHLCSAGPLAIRSEQLESLQHPFPSATQRHWRRQEPSRGWHHHLRWRSGSL